MVQQVPKSYDTGTLESKVERYWEENDIYRKVKDHWMDGEDFYFIDGPPYTSGYIHMGTAWNKILKDFMLRLTRAKGYNVRDQPGFDMHGLPIEVLVEKELGISNKKQIEEIGIDQFIEKCREFALKHKDIMTGQFRSLGVWMDWEKPYITITNSYIGSAWWALKRAEERELLDLAQRVLSWCPRCETALAEAEIEYKEKIDPSIYVKFKVEGKENEYIVVWTTTPWTIPSNLAVAVHPEFNYVRVKMTKEDGSDEILLVHEDCAESVGKAGRYQDMEVLETIVGEDLEGLKYEHPLTEEVPFLKETDMGYWRHKIVLADYVTADMTGCVHTAPGHGPDDFDTGLRYDLPPFSPVGEDGCFNENAGKYAGQFTKDADPEITADLDSHEALLNSGEVEHRYGHCWRCKNPITYRTTDQWFLRVTEMRQQMLDEIGKIDWFPGWAGSSRQYEWVANTRDWCISRQRFWGIPIPIWKCDCGERKVVGGEDDLAGAEGYSDGMNLHRPWIDGVTFDCGCGGKMRRVPDVLDVWFDSAVCSWAQLGYPGDPKEFERWWPCRWITEAHDQTRGWFYSQLGAGVVALDQIPYQQVLMHGFALDKDGKPMSKSLGNAIDPLDLTDKYGKDTVRLYLMKASAPWEDLPISEETIGNTRRMLNILYNVYGFSTLYMELDGFEPGSFTLDDVMEKGEVEDRWLLSRVERLKQDFNAEMEQYQIHKAARHIEHFIVEDLSRWYVRLSRDKTWIEGESPKKSSVYAVLHHALVEVAKVMNPITPFLSEEIYLNLDGSKGSINMEPWPEVDEKYLDEDLEKYMTSMRNAVEAVYSARQKGGRKLRWPVREITIEPETEQAVMGFQVLADLFKGQTNARVIKVLDPGVKWDGYEHDPKPAMKTIGSRFKENAGTVAAFIRSIDGAELKGTLQGGGSVEIDHDGFKFTIEDDMVSFEEVLPDNFAAESYTGGKVFIDLGMDDSIRGEGYSRELIRRVQEMRKQLDLNVEETIDIDVNLSEDVREYVSGWTDLIKAETRCRELVFADGAPEGSTEWDVDGESFAIAIKRTSE